MLDRRTLPLSGLRAFESAAKHLNLSRAGDDLGVTYSAISHQVRSLESTLGVLLFVRENNRLQLTEAGHVLFSSVRESLDSMIASIKGLDPENETGQLTVAFPPAAAAGWGTRLVCEFQSKFPLIQFQVQVIQPKEKRLSPDIDVAVCFGEPELNGRNSIKLASPPVYPVCSPKLFHQSPAPFCPKLPRSVALLHDQQNKWRDWFDHMRYPYPEDHLNLSLENTHMALQAARLGAGIALANVLEVRDDLIAGTLTPASKESIPEAQAYYLVTHPESNQSKRAAKFSAWIRSAISEAALSDSLMEPPTRKRRRATNEQKSQPQPQ